MKYYFYIDESGDHGLTTINPDFPAFLLCGVLVAAGEYENIRQSFNTIKQALWGNKEVIFHSRDIRKCEKEFSTLFDLEKKKWFYENINLALRKHTYSVFASAIQKDTYIKLFGRLSNDVYEMALSFIIERAILFLDDEKHTDKHLELSLRKEAKRKTRNWKNIFSACCLGEQDL